MAANERGHVGIKRRVHECPGLVCREAPECRSDKVRRESGGLQEPPNQRRADILQKRMQKMDKRNERRSWPAGLSGEARNDDHKSGAHAGRSYQLSLRQTETSLPIPAVNFTEAAPSPKKIFNEAKKICLLTPFS